MSPRIGVALGSGAARGLAHIPYLEALDELGVRPAIVAGSSIGALIGAGWAGGMSGGDLRTHALSVLGTLKLIAGRLWASIPSLQRLRQEGVTMQADALAIAGSFLPSTLVGDFAGLAVPFRAVATDLDSWEPVVFSSGPLLPAIAASIAIPALFKPVAFDGRKFIDGGAANPLPLDCARSDCDILVGIDVTGAPQPTPAGRRPSPVDVGLTATRIMTRSMIQHVLVRYPPDIYVQPPVDALGALEFWRVREFLASAESGKDGFKRRVEAAIAAFGNGGGRRKRVRR